MGDRQKETRGDRKLKERLSRTSSVLEIVIVLESDEEMFVNSLVVDGIFGMAGVYEKSERMKQMRELRIDGHCQQSNIQWRTLTIRKKMNFSHSLTFFLGTSS